MPDMTFRLAIDDAFITALTSTTLPRHPTFYDDTPEAARLARTFSQVYDALSMSATDQYLWHTSQNHALALRQYLDTHWQPMTEAARLYMTTLYQGLRGAIQTYPQYQQTDPNVPLPDPTAAPDRRWDRTPLEFALRQVINDGHIFLRLGSQQAADPQAQFAQAQRRLEEDCDPRSNATEADMFSHASDIRQAITGLLPWIRPRHLQEHARQYDRKLYRAMTMGPALRVIPVLTRSQSLAGSAGHPTTGPIPSTVGQWRWRPS